jgi:hypothetical protein
VIKYCDGGRHQSHLDDPVQVDSDTKLYFRGHDNVIAALNFVNKLLPLSITTDFTLQGCSAGALSTFAWTDFVEEFVRAKNPNIKYWALADSAFYVDYLSLKTGLYEYKV